ncbi:hypothetical protein G6F29_013141 [Rhizopus arrhizus]|uniref:Uncharacterized protein n=1 Tax=Rhizopus oryzae TaxID=64495 RepID=A0A9P7BKP9_RHIOR|nr:hypothetical protein G6F23_012394 [Rhizopus arrhizus]KAG1392869.1 hypothetical protein G6F58_012425 [Rhizopus delemar]KAG0752575.1 hypothetical protein G6F24_013495 [Rhizopus arrhizus]KAG0774434.1 hypothetical protein G6F22_014060 [Rhizopus arrhizus]KAG0778377.1 hypothetical protein G6F21_013009 [Rhizopus arrhizus]
MTDKTKTLTRYRNIISKWINDHITKKRLLSDLKTWLDTVDSIAFWQERSRTGTLAKSRAAYSAFVDNMIMEETQNAQTPPNDKVDQVENVEEDEESEGEASAASNKETQTPWIIGNANMTDLFQNYCEHIDTIKRPLYLESSLKELLAVAGILFPAPMDHSPEMIKVFGQKTLDDACKVVLDELMPANTPKISDKEFLEVTKIINSVDNKEISVRDAKRDLLRLAATINSTIGNVVEGVANL